MLKATLSSAMKEWLNKKIQMRVMLRPTYVARLDMHRNRCRALLLILLLSKQASRRCGGECPNRGSS